MFIIEDFKKRISNIVCLHSSKPALLLFVIICLNSIVGTVKSQEIQEGNVAVYVSSRSGERLTKKKSLRFSADVKTLLPVIKVEQKVRFQKIDGFGATFNEAGMICLNSISPKEKEAVLKNLFHPVEGSGYTAMKSPLGACDFSSAGSWYTYNDTAGDTLMKFFNIERDLAPDGQISFIKAAMKYGRFQIESPMDFAPDWMYKSMKKGERDIKPEYYNALAGYYLKYIQAYAERGVTINYLNLFNESGVYSDVPYPTIGELIKNHVGPLLKSAGVKTRIQLGETPSGSQALKEYPALLADTGISKYIHSLAFHGYEWGASSKLAELHTLVPRFPIWQTEICYALVGNPVIWNNLPPSAPKKLPVYDFNDGEFWGNAIMDDMKNWVSAWIYWNMILDEHGGPCLVAPEHDNPPLNQQHAVVIINRQTKKITYTGLYYYLAHFSRFIRPGAYRIGSTGETENLNFAAFENTDGTIVLNIINNSEETDCKVQWNNKVIVQRLKAHSITTLKWRGVPKE